ncbi:hypothetical protein G9A89_019371 [Geosiphon pyriformis]|nr:hypothetical protein G9A89_019371 [Geosiphon pyriformis]
MSNTAIFLFEFEELSQIPLFSRATLKEKPITAMYTNAKVDGQAIKLILDSGSVGSIIIRQLINQLSCQVNYVASAKIITANGTTKMLIGEINEFLFKINGLIMSIKVLVMEVIQYQALVDNNWLFKTNTILDWTTQELQFSQNSQHMQVPVMCEHFKVFSRNQLLIELKEVKEKPIWKVYQVFWTNENHNKLPPILFLENQQQPERTNKLGVERKYKRKKKGRKKNQYQPPLLFIPHIHILYHNNLTITAQNWYASIATKNCYQWAHAMAIIRNTRQQLSFIATHASLNALEDQNELKNGIMNYAWLVKKLSLIKEYGTTFLGKEEHVMNHRQAAKCLDGCPHNDDKIWQMALTKIEELKEINTKLCDYCLIPCDFQYCNKCDFIYNLPLHIIYTILEEEKPISSCTSELESIFNLDSNSDNDDNKNNSSSSIPNDHKNYNDSNFNSNSKTYIALPNLIKKQELKWFSDNNEGIMPESSKSSLAKKGIKIKGGIIDTEYVGNIIAMLQNDSEKAYLIDPNKKIAQAIFLPLVKIAQLMLMGNREKLKITTRGIQSFRSIGRIDIPYIVTIERKVKDQIQIFETKATFCELGEIGLVNLHIPVKNHSHIKIFIYNNTENIIKIPEGITIGYLTTKIENQLPNTISDFPQLCGYVDITSHSIYR